MYLDVNHRDSVHSVHSTGSNNSGKYRIKHTIVYFTQEIFLNGYVSDNTSPGTDQKPQGKRPGRKPLDPTKLVSDL